MLHSVQYAIDSEDRLVSFGGDWDKFARENDGGDLAAAKIHMRNLFDYIGDPALNQLWRFIVQRVREEKTVAVFNYRCDSPGLKRFMKMRVSHSEGCTQFHSQVLATEARPVFHVLESNRKLLIMCSWCKKVKLSDAVWLEPDLAVSRLRSFEEELLPEISHSICPTCLGQAMAQFNELP